MIFRKQFFSALCLVWLALVSVASANADEVERVIIVVNANDSSSVGIGEYYAEKRGIPKENIIALKTSTAETITIREYVDSIYNPLLSELLKADWVQGARSRGPDRYGRVAMSVALNRVSYLVTVRGVPLRISNDPTLLESNLGNLPAQFSINKGSVDGELALLLAPNTASMTAFVPNSLFENKSPTAVDLSRLLRVSRLDGPDPITVKKLVDRTLEAEADGLMGRAYFDIGGPHVTGDEWFNVAADLAEAAYFDTDVEATKKRIGLNSRYDAPAIYMGWYKQNAYGPWVLPRWSVPAGAIGFHLHSFSATTVRSEKTGWLGAFVKQGYCATMGNVYEPYLEYTHRPHRLLEHLLGGHTFGEAILYSNPSLSWMGVAIGDPLYRPFKVALSEQLVEGPEGPFASYVHLREINRLKAEVSRGVALKYARDCFMAQPSLALAYELSRLYAAEGQNQESIEALKIIRYITVFATDEQVLVMKIADQLHQLGDSELALETYEKLIKQPNLSKTLRIALLEGGAVVAEALGNAVQSSRWILEARQLKAPPASEKSPVKK